MVAADESSELLGHSVDQFLLISLIFPELCKHVILAASIFHPKREGEKEGKVCEIVPDKERAGSRKMARVGNLLIMDLSLRHPSPSLAFGQELALEGSGLSSHLPHLTYSYVFR